MRPIPLPMLIALAACAPEKAPVAGPPETRAERLAVLERIAADCQVPRAMLELVGEDELRLRPSTDEPYERVECVLRRIDGLNLPRGKVTFVGMPAPVPPPEADNVSGPEPRNAQTD